MWTENIENREKLTLLETALFYDFKTEGMIYWVHGVKNFKFTFRELHIFINLERIAIKEIQ